MKQRPSQHILGAGAVGHLVALFQTRAGFRSVLLGRQSMKPPYLISFDSSQDNTIQELSYNTQPTSDISYLWLAVKSHQVEAALESIRAHLNKDSKVLLLQNGMGNVEKAMTSLADILPPENIYLAINTHGALLDKTSSPYQLSHTGIGKLTIGSNYLCSSDNLAEEELMSIVSEQLNPEWQDNIEQALWLKLGINAVVNPLTALYQCQNGALLTKPELRSQVERLSEELEEFYHLVGYHQLANDFVDHCLAVIRATAGNYSSMMLDLKHGRPNESEAITGYLLSRADGVRLTMKAHRSLYHRLQKN